MTASTRSGEAGKPEQAGVAAASSWRQPTAAGSGYSTTTAFSITTSSTGTSWWP